MVILSAEKCAAVRCNAQHRLTRRDPPQHQHCSKPHGGWHDGEQQQEGRRVWRQQRGVELGEDGAREADEADDDAGHRAAGRREVELRGDEPRGDEEDGAVAREAEEQPHLARTGEGGREGGRGGGKEGEEGQRK